MLRFLTITVFLTTISMHAQSTDKKIEKSKTEKNAENESKVKPDMKKIAETEASNLSLADVKAKKSKLQKKRALMPYIGKYIEKEYVKKNEKELPKVENKIKALIKRIEVTTNPKTKQTLAEALKQEKIKLEVIKLWKVYHKAYVLYYESQQKNDFEKMNQAKVFLGKLKVRFKELTAKEFQDPKFEFYTKYRKQIDDAFKKEES